MRDAYPAGEFCDALKDVLEGYPAVVHFRDGVDSCSKTKRLLPAVVLRNGPAGIRTLNQGIMSPLL